jgi:UDP-glucuronate decarboxylase
MIHATPSDIREIADRLDSAVAEFEGARVLVTGANGFLGRYFVEFFKHLNEERLGRPCQVIAVDNFITSVDDGSSLDGAPNVRLIRHDIIDALDGSVIDGRIDYVIHLAGIASPYYYRKYPLETLEVATVGTKNVLRLSEEHQIRGFLYFSSSEIYGNPDSLHVPTPESYRGNVSPLGPRACYDEAKRVGETLCTIFHQQAGVPAKMVRPFNVYGPGMRRGDYRVLPNFATKIIEAEPLHVYADGTQTRTFCYVTDATVGFLQVLLNGIPGDVYNIGNPSPEITVLQLVHELEKVVERQIPYRLIEYPDSYPPDEPMRRCPDISKAQLQLGYSAEVTLSEGLRRFMDWAYETYPQSR